MISQDQRIAAGLLDAAVDGSGWSEALLDLAHSCKAQVGSMVLVDTTTRAGMGFCIGVEEKWSSAFVAHEARHVALGARLVKPGAVFTDRSVIGRRDFERSNFFEGWARPSGQTEYAGVAVLNDADRFVFVGLSRGPRRGAFDAAELRSLERLAPHIRRAARVWLALGAAKESSRTMEAAFDHIAAAVFLTDADARIKFVNCAAAELMTEDGPLTSTSDRLACANGADTERLQALIKAAARRDDTTGRAPAEGRLKLAAADGTQPLTLLVAPIAEMSQRPAPGAEVMVIGVGPPAVMKGSTQQLRAFFGLTRAEALLALQIVNGNGLKSAALALNMAPTTARTHLDRIFVKTGVRSQAALSALIVSGLMVRG